MGGGLMQLVAYGAQDIYLTGNPQITFFKVVYRRHTNFAVESIEQTFNGSATSNFQNPVTVSRNGDLLSAVWLAVTGTGAISAAEAWAAVDNVEVEVGGQVIDKQYGHWMQVWTDLSHPVDKSTLLDSCLKADANGDVSYLPLQFWFCRNPGLALPPLPPRSKLNLTSLGTMTAAGNVAVWCDYVFLDTDERRRFAQVSHEYLIEQVQFSNSLSVSGTSAQHELRFNHPVKELVWTVNGQHGDGKDITVKDALLQLNGHDRFKRREGKYFYNSSKIRLSCGADNQDGSVPHVYSFALKPEEHQPSGTCNFSRIDNAVLNLNMDPAGAANGLHATAVVNSAYTQLTTMFSVS